MFVEDAYIVAFLTVFGAFGVGIMTIIVQARRRLDERLRSINDFLNNVNTRLSVVEALIPYHHPPSKREE